MATLYYVPAETRRWLRKARDAVDALLNADEFDTVAADSLAHRTVHASMGPWVEWGRQSISSAAYNLGANHARRK